jgi:catechol 2,3-dioxygenase-like lactoylglutathione lyase family enzyme
MAAGPAFNHTLRKNFMAVQRLSHIGLCVTHIERSKTFYQEVFGYKCLSQIKIGKEADALLDLKGTDLDVVYLQRPGEDTRIELLYFKSPGTEVSAKIRAVNLTGITHFSFRVDNLQEIIALTQQHGGQFLQSTFSEYKKFGIASCMITDPDGTRIELLQAPGDPNALPGQVS